MEKPATIVGFKIGHALIDELDVMAKVKAQQAWRKIIARMRYKQAGLLNGIDVAQHQKVLSLHTSNLLKRQINQRLSVSSME